MKKSILIVLYIFFGCSLKSDPIVDSQKIENLKAFARVYGYVKYFHPSDEASEVNWNRFATYGASKVWPCETREELIEELRYIFEPIAPSIKFSAQRPIAYDISKIKPLNPDNFDFTFWQHRGVGLGMKSDYRSPYQSVRVNSMVEKEVPKNYGQLINSCFASNYRGKKLRFKVWAKLKDSLNTEAYIRMALVNSEGITSLKKDPVTSNNWKPYEIVAATDSSTAVIEVGAAIKGKGHLLVDDAELSYWEDNSWKTVLIEDTGFENNKISKVQEEYKWFYRGKGYKTETTDKDVFKGSTSAKLFRNISGKPEFGEKIFETVPEIGEVINEEIGNSMFCQIPIVLYSNEKGTFPKTNTIEFQGLQKEMDEMTDKANELGVRLGNIINSYNVFQHFYPYMDVVELDWDNELFKALSKSFKDSTANDHYITLEKFTSPLKDGHIYINFPRRKEVYAPNITWEWIENKLVITSVLNSKIELKPGDVVTHIDDVESKEYFQEVYSRISAGTKGWLESKAKRKSLLGEFEENMIVKVNEKEITLNRSGVTYNEGPRQSTYEKLNDEVYYLNISRIEMDTITKLLPELVNSKAIICDLRGYPNRNHMFLSHLLKENDTSDSWMQIPKIIYPNQKNIKGFEEHAWFLPSKEPYLGGKQIVFITDGRAISYAESYMGFIEGYNLATIIGQPTAGTNGNINTFDLEGGFSITWTGMKVLKHDGSQHHGIGIIPDIYLDKTIKGVIEGRDEFLDKAIELTIQK